MAAYFKMKTEAEMNVDLNRVPRAMEATDYHYNAAGVTPTVRLAVCVRPFIEHELQTGESISIVKMKGKQCMLTNPITYQPWMFTADFAFWSCSNDTTFDQEVHRI